MCAGGIALEDSVNIYLQRKMNMVEYGQKFCSLLISAEQIESSRPSSRNNCPRATPLLVFSNVLVVWPPFVLSVEARHFPPTLLPIEFSPQG